MTNIKNKKVLIKAIAVGCIFLLALALALLLLPSRSEAAEPTLEGFNVKSAQVRKHDISGIRFIIEADKTKIDALGLENVEYGAVLIPADMLSGELTLNTASVLNIKKKGWIDESESRYAIALVGSYNEETGEGTGLPESYYNRPITARGYVTGTKNGQRVTYYTAGTLTRSLGYVASMNVAVNTADANHEFIKAIASKTDISVNIESKNIINGVDTLLPKVSFGGISVPDATVKTLDLTYSISGKSVIASGGQLVTSKIGKSTVGVTLKFLEKTVSAPSSATIRVVNCSFTAEAGEVTLDESAIFGGSARITAVLNSSSVKLSSNNKVTLEEGTHVLYISGSDGSTKHIEVVVLPNNNPPEEKPALQLISLEMIKQYGDSTLIKYGDFEILIDGGESGDAANVKNMLSAYVTDGVLDMLIISHPHSDHMAGIQKLETFEAIDEIGVIIDNGITRTSSFYTNFKNNVQSHYVELGADYYTIDDVLATPALRTYGIDDNLSINFLYSALYNQTSDINASSIGFYIEYYNTFICMFGDATTATEKSYMELNAKFTETSDTVIYKASHHGSNGSNSADFLNYLEIDYCFISASYYGMDEGDAPNISNQHPYYNAITRIAVHTKQIYWNGINGTLHIDITDASVSVYGEGRTRNYSYGGAAADSEAEKNITYLKSKWYQYGIENADWTKY